MDLDGLLQRTRHLTAPPAHISLVRTAADNVPPRILRIRSSENWGKLNRVPSGCFSYKAIDKPHSQMFYAMILSSVCLSVCLFVCCLKCIHKNAVFSKNKQIIAMVSLDDQQEELHGLFKEPILLDPYDNL